VILALAFVAVFVPDDWFYGGSRFEQKVIRMLAIVIFLLCALSFKNP
jgi:hypothetical protein